MFTHILRTPRKLRLFQSILSSSSGRNVWRISSLFVLGILLSGLVQAVPITHTRTLSNVDFAVAGVSGVGGGSGTITVAGVSGTVTRAYLYWHGINNSGTGATYNNPLVFINGNPVTGIAVGDATTNCWGDGSSRAFEADVTAFVAGNGPYAITGLSSGVGHNANGASLVVVFDDGNATNNRDLAFFTGNDSNIPQGFPGETNGWHAVLTPIIYSGGPVRAIMHAADGQNFPDNTLTFTTGGPPLVISDTNTLWDGISVVSAGTSRAGNGNLWDIHTLDITGAFPVLPGPVTLNMDGQEPNSDCLGLVLLLLDLEPGSAPPPPGGTPTTLTLSPKDAVNPINTQHCVTATVTDENGNPSPNYDVVFSVTGANTTGGTVATNASGQATFCYNGTNVGPDVITAFADTDSDTTQDPGEPGDTANKLWYALAPGGGAFVIGDLNSAIGTQVTFWGAKWWKLNSLSGGAAPPAFKGFALNPAVPTCGTGWSTDPGNSAPPPNGPLPAFMGVIATSSTSKSGSTISGNTPKIVVVRTDPGYDSNPGHAGTGTVVANVCN